MRSTFIASAAAAVLATAVTADITVTFTNQTFAGFNFTRLVGAAAGSCTGTLTAVSINATLNASVAYTYADDICIYVDAEPLSTGGLLQVGGFSNLQATQRYFWPNGASSAVGTVVNGTVSLATPLTFAGTVADPTIWLGNGYGAAGTSGTWSGTVTLVGVNSSTAPPYDPCTQAATLVTGTNNNLPFFATAADRVLGTCGTAFKANFFKFVAPATGDYSFATCDTQTGTQLVGTRLGILDGCTAGASVLACADDTCGLDGRASNLSIALTAGTTYYVVVGLDAAADVPPATVVVTVGSPSICPLGGIAAYGDNAITSTANPGLSQVVQSDAAGTATATIWNVQWFRFTPSATGAFTFKTCNSGDTKLAIGTACPGTAQATFSTIAYSDDAPTCPTTAGGTTNYGSWIDATNNGATGTYAGFPLTQNLVAGQTYYICVGGWGSAGTVAGFLNISGPQSVPCPADLNNDQQVNGADLGLLLGNWGPCAGTPCLGDLNGDGVVNGADLGLLLGAWGACP